MSEKKQYFDILQIYRGIASLLVVIHHTYASFAYYHQLDIKILHFTAGIGKLGVDFFFVLSGFIIAYTTYEYRDKKSYLRKYIFNRVIRIYIPYLPIGIAMLLLYYWFPSVSNSGRSVSLITSLFLIPHGNPALSVAWTLVFEMFFYIIYSLNFFSRKLWYIMLTLWLAGIVTVAVTQSSLESRFLQIIFSLYNLEFILGVFAAYLVKNQVFHKISRYSLMIPAAVFLIFVLMKYYEASFFAFSQNLIFALAAAGFVVVGIKVFNKKMSTWNVWMLLGNSSYSLYLLHNPLQSILVRIVPAVNHQWLILTEFSIVIFLCCFISYFYYLIFEKYIMIFVKNKLEKYAA